MDYKKEINEFLGEIKTAKIDILMLQRENEKLTNENNKKIAGLNEVINIVEKELQSDLDESGEKKIDVEIGYVSYREQPDKWTYDEPVILEWVKNNGLSYCQTIETLKKQDLKIAILGGLIKLEEVAGLTIEKQEPKFQYKIKDLI